MHRLALFAFATLALAACWEVGGANTEQSFIGNGDRGNVLGEQVILSPDGRHLIAQGPWAQRAYTVDLASFRSVPLEITLESDRMAFGSGDDAYFMTNDSQGKGATIEKVSLGTGRKLGQWSVPQVGYLALDPLTDRIAVWFELTRTVVVLDPRDGDQHTLAFDDDAIIDVRWLRDGRLAVVPQHTWSDGQEGGTPTTTLHLYDRDWRERTIAVPNCASRLVLVPDVATPGEDELAMLAPTFCQKDPVSLVDLGRGEFLENLPGFGPVAFAPDGRTAIAFGRQAELAAFGIETTTPYSLLFIDTRTRAIETLDIGDSLPLYSLTPDGQVVLVYSVWQGATYDGIYMIDLASRAIRETSGPEVALNEFVVTPDSQLVYLIDGGLFRLDVKHGTIAYVSLACGGIGEPSQCNPELINMLPDGDTLVLGWRHSPEFAMFDVPEERVTRTFTVGQQDHDAPPLAQ